MRENIKIRGFTLIELLIVVAIISILASIAVPNFLEAQTRAKVSSVKSNMRTVATALETYAVDHNKYPRRQNPGFDINDEGTYTDTLFLPLFDKKMEDLKVLTTPISYISGVPTDTFLLKKVNPPLDLIDYISEDQFCAYLGAALWYNPGGPNNLTSCIRVRKGAGIKWALISVGPDGDIGLGGNNTIANYPKPNIISKGSLGRVYDPTFGTISRGNIFRLSSTAEDKTIKDIVESLEYTVANGTFNDSNINNRNYRNP